MMTTQMVLETSVSYTQLARLIAREDFIEFSRHKSSRSYNILRKSSFLYSLLEKVTDLPASLYFYNCSV